MNRDPSVLLIIVASLAAAFLLWLIVRTVVLWYFKIDKIVGLLEGIERNTRSPSSERPATVYYSSDGVIVDDTRLIVPPGEWAIRELQTVIAEKERGRYVIRLFNRKGERIHSIMSDDEDQANELARAINRAVGSSK